jgi:N-acetylmuramoyl-L-alanine amidase
MMLKKSFMLISMATGILQAGQLKKVYIHQVAADDMRNAAQLECAKIIFYFSQKPIVERIEDRPGEPIGWRTESYRIPVDTVDSSYESLVHEEQKSDHYRIRFAPLDEAGKGMRMDLSYDPQRIALVQQLFNAITHDKGLVFRLIDKKVLERLQPTNDELVRLVKNDMRRVVIDCGHGGKDSGAIGVNACAEKDVTLHVGTEVAQLLRSKGYEVLLTRDADNFVPLTERTRIVDAYRPDVYLSVHANSAPDKEACGIETYCLATDLFLPHDESIDKRLTTILNRRYDESHRLATTVHRKLLQELDPFRVSDRQVKHAVTQMLLGTNAPGVLVEVGFLTHPVEGLRLADATYRNRLAQGLCEGLLAYLNA